MIPDSETTFMPEPSDGAAGQADSVICGYHHTSGNVI